MFIILLSYNLKILLKFKVCNFIVYTLYFMHFMCIFMLYWYKNINGYLYSRYFTELINTKNDDTSITRKIKHSKSYCIIIYLSEKVTFALPVPEPVVQLNDVIFTIKTTKNNHRSRLIPIISTWFQSVANQTFFITDEEDSLISQLTGKFVWIHWDRWFQHKSFSMNSKWFFINVLNEYHSKYRRNLCHMT